MEMSAAENTLERSESGNRERRKSSRGLKIGRGKGEREPNKNWVLGKAIWKTLRWREWHPEGD